MKLIKCLSIMVLLSCKQANIKFDTCNIYELKRPTSVWELPKELNEISGIAVLNFPKIWCVNDEEGKLFIYNMETNTIDHVYKFDGNGDYEDVAAIGDSVYVLKSNGIIIQINDLKRPEIVKIHKTFLTAKENTEGLYFDKEKNRFLLACKNAIEINGKTKNVIYAYRSDLNFYIFSFYKFFDSYNNEC